MLESAPNASMSSLAAPSSHKGDGFSYGRTSSIQPQVFPSRPSLGRSQHSQSSLNSSTASSIYPSQRSYAVPPGLAAANASSVSLRSQGKPRSARVDYAPPLPAAAQWLLLTTPPPPPRASSNSLRSEPHHTVTTYPSRDSRDSQEEFTPKKSWGKKSLAALGLRGTQGPRPARKPASFMPPPTSASLAVNPRAAPARVQLQLGGGGVAAPRPSMSSRRGGRLDSRSEDYEIPRTWEDYALRYGLGEMNIEDPPFPPIQTTSHETARPTPYHEGNFNAPASPLEPIRQKLIARLDLLGRGTGDGSPSSSAMAHGGSTSSRYTVASSHRDSIFTNNRDSMASTAPSTAPSPSLPYGGKGNSLLQSSLPPTRSIQNHPSLLAVLAKSRKLFGTKTTIISILEEHRQFFLASEGMPDKVDSLPRSASLDSHTVLNGERGLVVLDTQRDWRFRSNMLSLVLNARFYAAMPIFAPSHPELEEEAGGRLPIGTIAILDDKCRLDFSPAERAKLRSLATDVSNEIHNWVSGHWERRSSVSSISSTTNRLKHVSFDSSSSYIDWQIKTATTVPPPAASSTFVARRVPTKVESLPPTPPGSLRRPGRYPDTDEDGRRPSATLAPPAVLGRGLSPMPEESPSSTPLPTPAEVVDHPTTPTAYVFPSAPRRAPPPPADDPAPSSASKAIFPSARSRPQPKSPQQKLFDAATSALGKGLDLSLVYLVSLDLTHEDDLDTPLTLLSAHGLPSSKPSFDPSLHLKALRAPEGGLLFKNPLVSASSSGKGEGPYASGILLPVCESSDGKMGWVLSSYTCDSTREFEEDELEYMMSVIDQLKKVIGWAARAERQ